MSYAITVEEATRGVYAAWRLLLRDRTAVRLLENSYSGAVRSFWAAVVVLPLYALSLSLELLTPSDSYVNFGTLAAQAGMPSAVIAEFCIFVLCWFVAWPLVVDRLAPWLDCDGNFFRYVSAYNWMHVVYALVGLLFLSLISTGLVAADSRDIVAFSLLALLWTYHWFVLRYALGVNGGFAALLVAAEVMFTTILLKNLIIFVAL